MLAEIGTDNFGLAIVPSITISDLRAHFGPGHYSTSACFTLRRFSREFVCYSCSTLLGGIHSWSLRDRLSFPLYGLMVSRYRRECASPLHLRDRNRTYTPVKLSTT
jgi:hypothetical protein